MIGFGTQPFGTSPFGGGVSPILLQNAVAIATRTVRVTLSSPPPMSSPAKVGDVLNPSSWRMWRMDTGRYFTILGITPYDAVTLDVLLLESLASHHVTHRVTVAVASATVLDFPGLVVDTSIEPPAEFDRDVRNPITTSDVAIGGSWLVVEGDYDVEQGEDLVRKLVLRRWITPRAAFKHMPNYGFGLLDRVKQPYLVNSLSSMAADMQRQAKIEREVEDARVRLALDSANSVLVVDSAIRLRAGKTIKIPFRVDTREGVVTL